MRNWILLFAMAVEICLLLYCLIRKTNHVPAGYLCAILAFVLLIATGWLLLFPNVTPIATTGKYQVAYVQTWYKDENRLETYATDGSKRELNVAFWYPANDTNLGKCPLVIFSHGSFGVKESNETLYRELASHGYVVASIDHTYQCFSTILSDGEKIKMSGAFMKEIMTDNPHKKPAESFINMKNWLTIRTGDLNFVLNTVIEKTMNEELELPIYNIIDTKRLIAMGHSLGGSAALALGRMRNDISAVISLEAPFMYDIKGLENNDFIFDDTEYPIPILNVYSDSSWSHLAEWKQYAQNKKYLELQSDKFQNIHLKGIGHMSLTDFSLTSPFLTMCIDGKVAKEIPEISLRKLNESCLAFINHHVASN